MPGGRSSRVDRKCTPSLFHMNFDPRNENDLGGAREELNEFHGLSCQHIPPLGNRYHPCSRK
jgi:hypothetical protein